MSIPLGDLELLAQGGQSKIYAYDDNTILRVPQRSIDSELINYEFNVYKKIQDHLLVPHVKELVEIDAKPCMVIEKIVGSDLFSILMKNPVTLFKLPKVLASLHSAVFQVELTDTLITNHSKAKYCINNSTVLDSNQKDKLLEILSTLENGTSLCHGDFHPGNILNSNGKNYIIDWSSATYGKQHFDIAHTYLLMINTPRLEHVSDLSYKIQKIITRYIGVRYLKNICKLQKINPIELWPYFLIKIAERTFYGMESEKPILGKFLKDNIYIRQKNLMEIKELA
jgi:uncharacterized protein (TIGR02172 family)